MKNDIVRIIRNEPRADSRLIAKQLEIGHDNFIQTISKYQDEFKQLGVFLFRTGKPKSSKGGRPEKFIMLNEDQSIFALTLSRNTKQVVEFKLALTKAFGKARQALGYHQSSLWQDTRKRNKEGRFELTDAIAEFVQYAKDNGSQNADTYFIHITRALNKAAFGNETINRNLLSEKELRWLTAFEYDIADILCQEIDIGTEYHEVFFKVRNRIGKITLILTA